MYAYCNGSKLIIPVPKVSADEVPLFLDLWKAHSEVKELHHLELTDAGFQKLASSSADRLAVFINGDATNIVSLVAFLFADEIVRPHLRRSDKETICRAGPLATDLIGQDRIPQFVKAIQRVQSDEGFTEHPEYSDLIGGNDIPSFTHLCAAYAVSVSLRRYSYALGTGRHPDHPIYRHHWIGSPVLRSNILPNDSRSLEDTPTTWFPWGTLFCNVFDPRTPLTKSDPSKVREVLDAIRGRAGTFREDYASLPIHAQERTSPSKPTERESLVIETLLEAGVAPLYSSTARPEMLAQWLRALVEGHPIWKIPVEVVTTTLQPQWVRRVEAKQRIKYRRDTFWDVFQDPGVRDFVKKRDGVGIRLVQ